MYFSTPVRQIFIILGKDWTISYLIVESSL